MSRVLNLAFYRFFPLPDPAAIRAELKALALECGLLGTVLLSPEGVNGFVAGTEAGARRFLQRIREIPGAESIEAKESWSDEIPFRRMLVKIKREIIPMRNPSIDPPRRTAPRLEPEELKAWLDQGRPVMLLDTRNEYEIELGTFRGAIRPGLRTFQEFPEYLARERERLQGEVPVVMFCTGGIRCEKAGALGQDLGLENVYQLEGGILKYFEKCGGAHYEGDCFVFDRRVALGPDLMPSTRHSVCYDCRGVVGVTEDCPECAPQRAHV